MIHRQEKRVGWWMDVETCIGCDRHVEELQHPVYIDMRPKGKKKKEPHAHNLIVMLCSACTNIYLRPTSWVRKRMVERLKASRKNCKCETFFMTQSDTPIPMIHSRS